ncbi:MAG: glycosyltransferase [Marmoricola sp.]
MTTLCLNMIVKNEAHVIRRCLDSVRPLIDSWVIVDTGSTDGTQDLIREVLADLPGQLHERPWRDFGHNRSEAIALARGSADYLFFMDADDTLIVPDGYVLPDLTADAYDIALVHPEITYRRICVVKSSLPWRFEGVLHEYPDCGRPVPPERLDLEIHIGGDGARSQQDVVEKYARDAVLLEGALADEPQNARYAFYLAQSYKDSHQPEKALAAYDHRATMGGFDEEVYVSMLSASRLARDLGRPPAEVIDRLLRTHDARPTRVEALGELAAYCRGLGRWASARMFAERGLGIEPSQDVLFVEPAWHVWKLVDEFAVATYWTGEFGLSLQASNDLLDGGHLPADQRARIQENKKFAAAKLGLQI